MSLTRVDPQLGTGAHLLSAVGCQCHYCGRRIERDPAIRWYGFDSDTYFHGPCALDYLARFARDVHQWQLETGDSVTRR